MKATPDELARLLARAPFAPDYGFLLTHHTLTYIRE